MWRADETEHVTDAPIKRGGILTVDPALPTSWWETFNASLSALGRCQAAAHAQVEQTRRREQALAQRRVRQLALRELAA